ncbi:hypothetical protein AV274_0046 [Blastocystis sp. ATCC 50177/Nand II]|uniref:Uncharacterized protein n=1 Tax=Blastocystis sp. subtype 1 (strain ATCC 50177 / NandII) TaxID=478820 RepID=A0A196SMC3_BLAHN|nr:hypothetical protein AV274_0046 [Blastocystis sp. ATCC 50177/Nand II]
MLAPFVRGHSAGPLLRTFAISVAEAGDKLLEYVYNGLQSMKEVNNPFEVQRSSTSVIVNSGKEKEYIISVLQNGNARLQSPRNHYNDYRYNPENETFENIEDGHNIIEAFTRDIMSDYGGYPDF